mmetsp:Transcript_33119/g.71391  ORF Transcript_33119/g.71391 Transcript_33119/m.71391 type:complete len:501 (+) Transcript_33119:807-2309(+)
MLLKLLSKCQVSPSIHVAQPHLSDGRRSIVGRPHLRRADLGHSLLGQVTPRQCLQPRRSPEEHDSLLVSAPHICHILTSTTSSPNALNLPARFFSGLLLLRKNSQLLQVLPDQPRTDGATDQLGRMLHQPPASLHIDVGNARSCHALDSDGRIHRAAQVLPGQEADAVALNHHRGLVSPDAKAHQEAAQNALDGCCGLAPSASSNCEGTEGGLDLGGGGVLQAILVATLHFIPLILPPEMLNLLRSTPSQNLRLLCCRYQASICHAVPHGRIGLSRPSPWRSRSAIRGAGQAGRPSLTLLRLMDRGVLVSPLDDQRRWTRWSSSSLGPHSLDEGWSCRHLCSSARLRHRRTTGGLRLKWRKEATQIASSPCIPTSKALVAADLLLAILRRLLSADLRQRSHLWCGILPWPRLSWRRWASIPLCFGLSCFSLRLLQCRIGVLGQSLRERMLITQAFLCHFMALLVGCCSLLQLLQIVPFHGHVVIGNGKDRILVLGGRKLR